MTAIADPSRPTLTGSRASLSAGCNDAATAQAITAVLAGWSGGSADATEALEQLQGVLEGLRHLPEGETRTAKMNAFVRTLGRADNLATFLDLLRGSLLSSRQTEPDIAERSRSGRSHCIYGWAGQSIVLASNTHELSTTTPAPRQVADFMGYPLSEWHASIHVWQPNPEAVGFESTKRVEAGVIAEPPHSHPFNFVSYVSVGELRQSTYEECAPGEQEGGRYVATSLERVDGVWPPHREYTPSLLRTLEDGVVLRQGDSYAMSTNQIHDVEVQRAQAMVRPAITLFLCSETVQVPNAYMVASMADFHRDNPELTSGATALDVDRWSAKLVAIANYLRGETSELMLGDIVQCGSSYGFMNV